MAYNAITADVLQRISSDDEFYALAGEAFHWQQKKCAPFSTFLQGIKYPVFNPDRPAFLPIELFKSHRVFCAESIEATFLSSGTGSGSRSSHHFASLDIYRSCSAWHFEALYGPLENHRILALLPSYLEQGDSSLVFMVHHFMTRTRDGYSHFYLEDFEALKRELERPFPGKTLLIGVSYALLDFSLLELSIPSNTVVMETGGMKGRKKEMIREELHDALCKGFHVSEVHSEYGMTELSSQAYSLGNGWFNTPPWMRCFVTDISDPLSTLPPGRRGCLAFIDLANRDSCAFIQTRDIGLIREDGAFRVEGRMDQSDLRGCNLLYT